MRYLRWIAVLIGAGLFAIGQNTTGSLGGRVVDATGAALPKARIRLTQESTAQRPIEGATNDGGEFSFTDLPVGTYAIECWMLGFVGFNVKSVRIDEGAKTTLPPLILQVGGSGRCGRQPPDHRVLEDNQGLGSLSGKVQVYDNSSTPPPLARATVALCNNSGECSKKTTNQNGEFIFAGLHPGMISLQIAAKGYYAFRESGFNAEEGWDVNYGSFDLYRCRDKACTPVPPNKRKVTVCQ